MKLFRIWLGVTEYLFRSEQLLDEVIDTAIEDNTFRSDDLEFTFAARVSMPHMLCGLGKRRHSLSPVSGLRHCNGSLILSLQFFRIANFLVNATFYRLGLTAYPSVTSTPTGKDSKKFNNISSHALQTRFG